MGKTNKVRTGKNIPRSETLRSLLSVDSAQETALPVILKCQKVEKLLPRAAVNQIWRTVLDCWVWLCFFSFKWPFS